MYFMDRAGTTLPIIHRKIRIKYQSRNLPALLFSFFCHIFTLQNKTLPFHPPIPDGIHLENYIGEIIKNKIYYVSKL
ncbi:hypothetical protein ACM46_20600 [Chryseobacterium angstadtii]|uniref:Uncharacterized protein n=1 Tax=Chryseobacterium angstadtii TaxID=558151 RepID=A0A0J7I106_9FLAO|nr:hypothetical protein ACM46_20600 [Chryseobacterium angstadtii]